CTLPDDRDRLFRDDDDAERMGERAIEGRARHGGYGGGLLAHAIEIHAEQARAEIAADGVFDLQRHRGGGAVDFDRVDGEDRRIAGDEVAADRGRCDAEGHEQGPRRGCEPRHVDPLYLPAARQLDHGTRDPHGVARLALDSSPRHDSQFASARRTPALRRTGYASGRRRSPSRTTSCSSSMPCSSRTRRRASAISARQSALVAPPAFSMKFACMGEITAPPTRWSLSPHSSISFPAPIWPSGFLNTDPNVRFVV